MTMVVNVRCRGAMGDGVADDAPAIQRAIDALNTPLGGEVYLPAGTYILGTSDASTNFPLALWSNIALRGDGRGKTVLKVCDNARQLSKDPRFSFAPSACAITTKSSAWWHGASPPIALVSDIGLIGLTLDGDKNEQLSLYTPGNRTTTPFVPNPGNRIQGSEAVSGGSLVAGRYFACVTYTDSLGNETASTMPDPYYVDIVADGGLYAVQITPLAPPTGAVGMVLYFRESHDLVDSNPVYARIPQEGLPASITVTKYTPGTAYPPGSGVVNFYGNSGSSAGLYLERVDGITLTDVEIRDFVLEGIMANERPVTHLRATRVQAHDLGRHGSSISDTASDWIFDDCDVDRCTSCGIDIEGAGEIARITYRDCRLTRSGIAVGMTSSSASCLTRDILFEHCTLEENWSHVRSTTAPGARNTDIRFQDCTFGYAINIGGFVASEGHGFFEGCTFDRVCRGQAYNPRNYYARDESPVEFSGVARGWRVVNCTFIPFAESGITAPMVHASNGARDLVVAHNHFDKQATGSQELFRADTGTPSDSVVKDNTGDGEVWVNGEKI